MEISPQNKVNLLQVKLFSDNFIKAKMVLSDEEMNLSAEKFNEKLPEAWIDKAGYIYVGDPSASIDKIYFTNWNKQVYLQGSYIPSYVSHALSAKTPSKPQWVCDPIELPKDKPYKINSTKEQNYKSVFEHLKVLATGYDIAVVTATQGVPEDIMIKASKVPLPEQLFLENGTTTTAFHLRTKYEKHTNCKQAVGKMRELSQKDTETAKTNFGAMMCGVCFPDTK